MEYPEVYNTKNGRLDLLAICEDHRVFHLSNGEFGKERQQEGDSIGSVYPSYDLIRAVTPSTLACNAIHVTCVSRET